MPWVTYNKNLVIVSFSQLITIAIEEYSGKR